LRQRESELTAMHEAAGSQIRHAIIAGGGDFRSMPSSAWMLIYARFASNKFAEKALEGQYVGDCRTLLDKDAVSSDNGGKFEALAPGLQPMAPPSPANASKRPSRARFFKEASSPVSASASPDLLAPAKQEIAERCPFHLRPSIANNMHIPFHTADAL